MRSLLCASVQVAGRKVPFSRQAVTFFHLHGMGHSRGGPNGGYSWHFPTRVTPRATSKNCAGRLLGNGKSVLLSPCVICAAIRSRTAFLTCLCMTIASQQTVVACSSL